MYFEIFGYLVQSSNQKPAIIKQDVFDQPEDNGEMTSHSNFGPSHSNFKVSFGIQFVNFRFNLVRLEKFGYHKQSFNAKPFTVKQGMSNQWSKYRKIKLHSNWNMSISKQSYDVVSSFCVNLVWFRKLGYHEYPFKQKLFKVKARNVRLVEQRRENDIISIQFSE